MGEASAFLVRAVVIGIGGTIAFDLFGLFLQRFLQMPPTNWAMAGRWFGHFLRGRFIHDSIAKAAPIPGELAIGWLAHYVIGVAYGVILLAIWGVEWAQQPTLLPALIVALAGLVAPLLVMQPGMGAGIAGSKTPNPTTTRIRSVLNHTVFGLGLYASALLLAQVLRS